MAEGESSVLFLAWLDIQRIRQDPVGELARDARHDVDAPDDPSGFVNYVGTRGLDTRP